MKSLFGVETIDNLHRLREEFPGQVPNPLRSVSQNILPLRLPQTAALSLRLRIPSAGLVTSRFYNFVIAIEFKVLEHRCLSAGPTNLNPERRFPVGHAKENARVIL